jgi:hypothetical protein
MSQHDRKLASADVAWNQPSLADASPTYRLIALIDSNCRVNADANKVSPGVFALQCGLILAAVEPTVAGAVLEYLADRAPNRDAAMRENLRELAALWKTDQ